MSRTGLPYDEAVKAVIPGAVVREARASLTILLPCTRCDGRLIEAFTSPNRLPPEVIEKKLKQRGWRLGRHPICPAVHPGRVKETKDMADTDTVPTPAPAIVVPPPAPRIAPGETVSDAARRAKREAVEWLGEAFDVPTGQYKAGVSDATIAAETGLAENVIASLRESLFGEIKMPPELLAAQSELSALKLRVATFEKDMTAACDTLARQISEGAGALARDIGNAALRFEQVRERNGWKP